MIKGRFAIVASPHPPLDITAANATIKITIFLTELPPYYAIAIIESCLLIPLLGDFVKSFSMKKEKAGHLHAPLGIFY